MSRSALSLEKFFRSARSTMIPPSNVLILNVETFDVLEDTLKDVTAAKHSIVVRVVKEIVKLSRKQGEATSGSSRALTDGI